MFQGKKIPDFVSFQKNEKPQSIYRTAIHTENQIGKILEKTLPSCSWCTFLKLKI